ncbi:probable calcium-binding protein CML27 [Mercurialis annua]|uniref:probable calcium-binding protein CML27 n=1 Tax=Mercurialis annua TaxID=3986 RepID=UPI0021604BC5|nr:probable calcium-binding protein CML27 [Mercurialis annua]
MGSTSTNSPLFQSKDELQKVFNQFDANQDGKISLSELGGVLKAMGSPYTEAELERVMEDVDTDRDGFINLEEFSQICKPSESADAASSELRDAFDLYDQNKNGLISSGELHLVLNRLGMHCSVEDCVRMIKTVDSDGDGCVDFVEFQKMMANNAQNIGK